MKKRFLSLAMSMLLIAGMAAGCSSKPADSGTAVTDTPQATSAPTDTQGAAEGAEGTIDGKGTSLTVLCHSSWRTEEANKVFDYVADKYNVKFEFEEVPEGGSGEEFIYAKVQSGEVPDILWFQGAQVSVLNMGEDTFAELSGDWTKDYSDTILESPKQTVNGKLLCAPFGDVTTFGMCYNKKVFTDNNVAIPQTWDELMAACETFKKAGVTPIFTSGAAGNEWTLQIFSIDSRAKMLLKEQGIFDKLNNHSAKWADDEYSNWMLSEFKGLFDKGYTQDTFLSDTYEDAQQALLTGSCAMYPQATWVYSELAKVAESKDELDNIGMFAIPSKDGSATVAYTETPTGFLVPAAGKNVELAKQIAGALSSKDAMSVYYQNHSGVPSVNGIDVDLLGIPKDAYAMIQAGKTQSQPYMIYSVPSLATDIQAMLAGDKTSKQVLEGTDNDWDTYAKDNKNADWGY